jgi:hypothetical protein
MKQATISNVPSGVINEIRSKMNLLGTPNLGDVTSTDYTTWKGASWEITFSHNTQVVYSLTYGKIVSIHDQKNRDSHLSQQSAGQPTQITKQQSITLAQDVIQKLGWTMINHQLEDEPELDQSRQDVSWAWYLFFKKEINGLILYPGGIRISLNPYDGMLTEWECRDLGDCILNTTSNVISGSQALSIATQAYLACGGSPNDERQGAGLFWMKLHNSDEFYRMAYLTAL